MQSCDSQSELTENMDNTRHDNMEHNNENDNKNDTNENDETDSFSDGGDLGCLSAGSTGMCQLILDLKHFKSLCNLS